MSACGSNVSLMVPVLIESVAVHQSPENTIGELSDFLFKNLNNFSDPWWDPGLDFKISSRLNSWIISRLMNHFPSLSNIDLADSKPNSLKLFIRQLNDECGIHVNLMSSDIFKNQVQIELSKDILSLLKFIDDDPVLVRVLELSRAKAGHDPAHDLNHFLRVASLSLKLSKSYSLNPRLVICAALLHDVVNLQKNEPNSKLASQLSSDLARNFLTDIKFGSELEILEIASAIATHSFSSGLTPDSNLGGCLQDSDRLDALGSIGLLRLISVGAQIGSVLYDSNDPWAERRPLDDKKYMLDHFFVKLIKVIETMNTLEGRAEGIKRVEFMWDFFKKMIHDGGLAEPKFDLPLFR